MVIGRESSVNMRVTPYRFHLVQAELHVASALAQQLTPLTHHQHEVVLVLVS